MAVDRFIYFECCNLPTVDQLREFLVNFFGDVLEDLLLSQDEKQLRASLIGNWSHYNSDRTTEQLSQGRSIEIHFLPADESDPQDLPALNIVTRYADPYTNTLANGLVLHLCLWFEGQASSANTFQLPPMIVDR